MGYKLDTKKCIERFNSIHGNEKYDYSNVVYVNQNTKVEITCKMCGNIFNQIPKSHFIGKGCPNPICVVKRCVRSKKYNYKRKIKGYAHTTEEWIKIAKNIHGNKFDYSKVEYVHNKIEICIICPIHGEFFTKPISHLETTYGCKKCWEDVKKKLFNLDRDKWIEMAKKRHGNKFDYSKVEYVNQHKHVCIICPIHGEFYQNPNNHLRGRGCEKCKGEDNIYEQRLYNVLNNELPNIKWVRNFRDKSLFGNFELDFYNDEYKIAIEHQGSQHFFPVRHFGGVKKYNEVVQCDILKHSICQKNNITLLYFAYEKIKIPEDYIDIVYQKESELINNIKIIIKN